MMCYKDMTFCQYYKDCHLGEDCSRALTSWHEMRAEKAGLLIARFADKPECWSEKKTL